MDTPEHDFAQFRATGSATALAAVFDALAPELLLVAAHLAPRGVEAEDILQTTFLSAIEGAARWDAARPLLPWLIGILVHTVRAEARRRDRHPDPARLPPRVGEPTPPQASEAQELAEQVASALRELPVPYRQVLSLRLVHGLSAAEIAHTLACPLATVKTRLQRGLDRLREGLPAGLATPAVALLAGRGLAAVQQAVLEAGATMAPVANATVGVGVASVEMVGGVLMKKVLVGAGAIVLASVAWMAWPRGAEPSPPTVLDVDAPVVIVADPRPSPPPPVDVPAAPERTVVAAPIVATTGSLRVACVWKEDGAPAAGVDVSCVPEASSNPRVRRQRTSADAAGSALLADLTPGRYRVYSWSSDGGAPAAQEVRAGACAEVRLELEPKLILEGVVVDADGRPAAGATVRGFDLTVGDICTLATSDATGAFRWRGGDVTPVWAERWSAQPSVQIAPDRSQRRHVVRLQLGAIGCALAGIVLRPDGSPAGDALVAITVDERTRETRLPDGSVNGRRPPLVMRADSMGRFATASVPPGRHTVLARIPGCAAARIEVEVTDMPGELVILCLPRGAIVRGTPRDELGRPLTTEGAHVVSARPKHIVIGLDPVSHLFLRTLVEADGVPSFELHGVQPGTMWLSAAHPGKHEVRHEVELTDGQELTWDPVLGGGPRITGRVVDGDDRPLAGWEVMATALSLSAGQGLNLKLTDAEGRFTFEGVADCEHRLIALGPSVSGAAAAMPWAVETKVRPGGGEVVLRADAVLADACSITGEVLGPDGKAMANARVVLMPRAGVTSHQPTERPDARTGRFEIGPLPAGEYRIHVEVEGKGSIQLGSRSLAPRQKLDLGTIRFAAPGTATIAFAPESAAPGTDLDLVLRGDSGYASDFFIVEDGARRSVPVLPGSYTLEVWGPGIAPVTRQVEVVSAGDTRTTLSLQKAADVTIEVVPETHPGVAFLVVDLRIEDGAQKEVFRRLMQIHRKGDVYPWSRGLPAGEYRVTARMWESRSASEARFTVPAGTEPRRVRLALAPTPR